MPYGEAPWVFTGRALYQLQLVPLAEAKKHIPPEFRIVSLFGYTLGGFYLARYDDSPCGPFDELVALAGLAWDPPASAAWAARVLVSSAEARAHGRAACGLPSAAASFEAAAAAAAVSGSSSAGGDGTTTTTTTVTCPASPSSKEAFDFSSAPLRASSRSSSSSSSSSARSCWWHPREERGSVVVVRNADVRRGGGGGGWRRRKSNNSSSSSSNGFGPDFVCSLELPALPRKKKSPPPSLSAAAESSSSSSEKGNSNLLFSSLQRKVAAFASSGPRITMKLPSFSGATPECPGLLKYACDLSARVRLVKPVVVGVRGQRQRPRRNADDSGDVDVDVDDNTFSSSDTPSSPCLSAVLGGKPLLCLEFGEMRMRVEQPEVATVGQKKKKKRNGDDRKKKDDDDGDVAAPPPRWWSRQQQGPSSSSSPSRGALLA